jgi:hypothetical protein
MSEIAIYVDVDAETRNALLESGVSLEQVVGSEIDARVDYRQPPWDQQTAYRDKSLTTVILVSGAAAYLVIRAVTKLLDAIAMRPRVVTIHEVRESFDDEGRTVYTRIPIDQKLLEPERGQEEETIEINLGQKILSLQINTKSSAPGGK